MQREFEGDKDRDRTVEKKSWRRRVPVRVRRWCFRLAAALFVLLFASVIYAVIAGKPIPDVIFNLAELLLKALTWL